MNLLSRTALLGAMALVAFSRPAYAVGSMTVTDAPLMTSSTAQLMTQRSEQPAFFKQSKKKKPKK